MTDLAVTDLALPDLPVPDIVLVATPPGFSFRRTVTSHGWSVLAPFALDRSTWTLTRGRVRMQAVDGGVAVTVPAGVTGGRNAAGAETVTATVRHCLRLDDDLGEFGSLCSDLVPVDDADVDLRWVPAQGAGRLLRSPTVWEDLIKTVCTTNCSWALTTKMVHGLVAGPGAGDFPSAEAVAAGGPELLRTLSFGYRAAPVVRIAELVAEGVVDPQRWLDPDLPADELRRQVQALPGCGPYTADNVARLCGHHDGLAIDSWVRATLRRRCGYALDDRAIAARYARFGRWRGLALWCDVTADWLDDGGDKVQW